MNPWPRQVIVRSVLVFVALVAALSLRAPRRVERIPDLRDSVGEHRALLSAGHSSFACGACHIYDESLKAVRYGGTREDCAFCHKDPHAGQFRVQGKTSCERCHRDASAWQKTVFNHNTMSVFKLSSAHAKVACKECHPETLTSAGRRVTLYKPIKHSCEDCHAAPQ